ncbi:MAG: bifunctional [glutamate--ammonia ligase]-adenylyl-L-tyrosine phosphorylase/[glutamate--ammonia-ligase] adenylyltransferase [Gammaproteobacteria bacterium]|jgi:glutamate-ammonia-ligase adenylyltransferase|nr:bifunctional [glutamate--ammonia ligase]-adenylyl-L-tyrosine phosphorylase/[glutamate--ammonia-ligase] adenylyltransferase [Gammaproteobacteria bacterium]
MSSIPSELIDTLPPALRDSVSLYWQHWCQACAAQDLSTDLPVALAVVGRVWACSDFVARLSARKPAMLKALLEQGPDSDFELADFRTRIQAALAAAPDNEAAVMAALRVQRQREMLRIAWRDLNELAPLEQILHELSDFAEAMVSETLNYLHHQAVEVMGTPMSEAGEPQFMLVLGMGKLGGRELNFSSDIDLIFVYPEEGETQGGRRPLSNHEFFLRLAGKLVKFLNETTQDGFVFRVDTRLRPNGESGPLAMGFGAVENYYQSQGRDWERYAMIKARALTGRQSDIDELENTLRPFIYRRYLDFSTFESIREMKGMIESEVRRKGIADNVKLGRGGIREIEFIGQTFQLLRGGRDTALQKRGIMPVLNLLVEMKLLESHEVAQLQQAYHFLRRLENRIQMYKDMQAHNLPVDEVARQRLALAMNEESWQALAPKIEAHRDNVHTVFQAIISREEDEPSVVEDQMLALKAYWANIADAEELLHWLENNNFSDADAVLKKLKAFRKDARIRSLSEQAVQRLLKLLSKLLAAIAAYPEPGVLMERVLQILSAVAGRQVYINLLLEYAQARAQMLSLCSTSAWFVQQLKAQPILMDELLDADELYQAKDYQALAQELEYLLSSVQAGDLEQYMDRLRQFKNIQVMKTAVLDVNQILSVSDVGSTLSHIAEVVLVKTLQLAWDELCHKHGRPACCIEGETVFPAIAIVAYGKLGGLELGYGSDLDIVFLHGSAGENQLTEGDAGGNKVIDNSTFFSRVAQKVLHILGARMHSGLLYETDIRLRPQGQSGLMVSSLNAFELYQRDKAWTWEHQALIRARIVAGNDHVRQEFVRIRHSVLARPRDALSLCRDVAKMRYKMRDHLSSKDTTRFDIKQDTGGIIDIEFLTQAGVLLHAQAHSELLESTSTLIFLSQLVACDWLTAQESESLSQAYRQYRLQVNRQALMIAALDDDTMSFYRENVEAVWQRLMPAKEQIE